MRFNELNQEFEKDKLVFKPISLTDTHFVNEMFENEEIKKFYFVPKEAHRDYRLLTKYWINDVKNKAGTAWKITKKGGLFSRNKHCGFVAFEFRGSTENARISYAILPKYRKNGIASTAVNEVILRLEKMGVKRVEAVIDRDNLIAEKVVEKNGFVADKSKALIDPDDPEMRMSALWA